MHPSKNKRQQKQNRKKIINIEEQIKLQKQPAIKQNLQESLKMALKYQLSTQHIMFLSP